MIGEHCGDKLEPLKAPPRLFVDRLSGCQMRKFCLLRESRTLWEWAPAIEGSSPTVCLSFVWYKQQKLFTKRMQDIVGASLKSLPNCLSTFRLVVRWQNLKECKMWEWARGIKLSSLTVYLHFGCQIDSNGKRLFSKRMQDIVGVSYWGRRLCPFTRSKTNYDTSSCWLPMFHSGFPLEVHLWNKDTWLIRTLDWVPTLYKYILYSPWNKNTSLIRTIILVTKVSVLERFHMYACMKPCEQEAALFPGPHPAPCCLQYGFSLVPRPSPSSPLLAVWL